MISSSALKNTLDKKLAIVSRDVLLNNALEVWFIQNELFKGIPISIGLDASRYHNTTVIYLEIEYAHTSASIDLKFIQDLKHQGCRVILFHMGDELGISDKSSYVFCDEVIRNYYFANLIGEDSKNINWAPNGFKTGVGPRNPQNVKSATSRSTLASFIGNLNPSHSFNYERETFFEATKDIEQFAVYASEGFNQGLNTSLYAAITEDSIFIPCPAGRNAETIRLYDALELGCIPITLHHPFINSRAALGAMGLPPFPMLHSWNELPEFIARMHHIYQTDPKTILDLQTSCLDWWSRFKLHLKNQISLLTNSS